MHEEPSASWMFTTSEVFDCRGASSSTAGDTTRLQLQAEPSSWTVVGHAEVMIGRQSDTDRGIHRPDRSASNSSFQS